MLFLMAQEGSRVHVQAAGSGAEGVGLGQGLGDEGGFEAVHLGLKTLVGEGGDLVGRAAPEEGSSPVSMP